MSTEESARGTEAGKPAGATVVRREPAPTASGPGRLLVAVYAVLAIAASGRAGFELVTKFHAAPIPYALSAFSAVVYLIATVALARGRGLARAVAWVTISVELLGVLSVGTISLLRPEDFPKSTVWSGFGQGYGYVPLVLPILGLIWLWRTRRAG
jgi:hypothetical protein